MVKKTDTIFIALMGWKSSCQSSPETSGWLGEIEYTAGQYSVRKKSLL
jgi:hypothetical protein